jgi:hypothetical protein
MLSPVSNIPSASTPYSNTLQCMKSGMKQGTTLERSDARSGGGTVGWDSAGWDGVGRVPGTSRGRLPEAPLRQPRLLAVDVGCCPCIPRTSWC